MTLVQDERLSTLFLSFFAPRPKETVSDWCCHNLRFNEPNNSGPFVLRGRGYIREILDCMAEALISDMCLVFGSQSGKTAAIMGMIGWLIAKQPSRVFWVMPTMDTVKKFSRTRWMPLVRASESISGLIPTGARRHDFATGTQILGGSIVEFVWSNSPAALASTPAPVVILDEVDKFNEGGRREANAVDLAMQRTKNFAIPKRIKTSTPTLTEGLIWQEFLKTDQRRRFLPCPHCGKFVVLIWSKAYTVFKSTGCEAAVQWDKEAKRPDGTWDLDRVERSARFLCPHCGGHIQDAHKTLMDRNGEWRSTAQAARGYRGWHLPSLYAASAETNVGKLAVKFLQAKHSLAGLQGFINGDLAEPYQSQESQGSRTETIIEISDLSGRAKLLSVDVQSDAPHFWWAILLVGNNQVHVFKVGNSDTWEDIREVQTGNHVQDVGVFVDSGDRTKRTGDSVYVNCARFCIPVEQPDNLPTLMGWAPCKGMPADRQWIDRRSGTKRPFHVENKDPYEGTSKAGIVNIGLFEFSGSRFKDRLQAMRTNEDAIKFSVEKDVSVNDEFWRHMDAEHKATFFNKRTRRPEYDWIKKSRHWPNHWLDCVVQGIAAATRMGCLRV